MSNEAKARHGTGAGIGSALVEDLKRTAASHEGWYGHRPIADACRYWPMASPSPDEPSAGHKDRTAAGATFGGSTVSAPGDDIDRLIQLSPLAAIRERLASPPRLETSDASVLPLRFAVITANVSNLSLFVSCARSIAELLAEESSRLFKDHFRWVVHFESPTFSIADLEALVPPSMRAAVRWAETRSGGQNKTDGLAQWPEFEGYWLIFLSDDNRIAPMALDIASHYAKTFPDGRFLVPAYGVLDQGLNRLIGHGHGSGGDCLFEQRWPDRHVIFVRHDLYIELASEKIDMPAGDGYGLALKASLREPLLFLPEVLSFRTSSHDVRSEADSLHRRIELSVRRRFLRDWAQMRWPQHGSSPARRDPRPPATTALCIVRTQGAHLDLLRETIESIRCQIRAVTACVVVHGSQALYDDVLRWLGGSRARLVILHAWAPGRNRGYPLNVALDFLMENAARYTCFSFLDDDDILYPLFFERQMWALDRSQADVTYALSNQRQLGTPTLPAHPGKPLSFIVAGNFIPIHCYVVRTDVLFRTSLRFREDMHYLEDWDFLLQLLRLGVEFHYLPEVLCEYRIIGDGNVDQKRDPELYEICRDRVQAMAQDVVRRRGCGAYLRDLADFDVSSLFGLAPGEIKHAADAWAMAVAADDAENHD